VDAGTVILVGTDEACILRAATTLLEDAAEYNRMTRMHNPYGDGHACDVIASSLEAYFSSPVSRQPT